MNSDYDDLDAISENCRACKRCKLGSSVVKRHGLDVDPHLPAQYHRSVPLPQMMIVYSAPSLDDVFAGIPLSGAVGTNFDGYLDKFGDFYGITRRHFYITSCVKCWSKEPPYDSIDICKTILKSEIEVVKPRLVITLGKVAFKVLAGDVEAVPGKMTKSEEFGVKIYPTIYPTLTALANSDNLDRFKRDINAICQLIFRLDCPF